jgi:hypothetical protein
MKSHRSRSGENLGERLALPFDWRQQLRPLSAAWLSHADFSLTSLRVSNSPACGQSENYQFGADGLAPK